MKTRVVIFTPNNARILPGVDPALYKDAANAVINPDLSAVRGVAPHYWKWDGERVLPMGEAERAARDLALQSGAQNTPILVPKYAPAPSPEPVLPPEPAQASRAWIYYALAAAGAASALTYFFL